MLLFTRSATQHEKTVMSSVAQFLKLKKNSPDDVIVISLGLSKLGLRL